MKIPCCFLLSVFVVCIQSVGSAVPREAPPKAFPFILPKEKPDRPLSAAMERSYTAYMAPRPEHNELYSQFKYTKLEGFDYNGGDGTITRRDPSKIILENGKYYVWYTHRESATEVGGEDRARVGRRDQVRVGLANLTPTLP